MTSNSLKQLYEEELRNLFDAESQLVEALRKMAKTAQFEDLGAAFQEHLEQTQEHIRRLGEIFEDLDKGPKGRKCKGMEGLIEESVEMIAYNSASDAMDAALILSAQRIEHYKIASYGCVCEYARLLGHGDAISLLELTLAEEKESDDKLTGLAEEINAFAVDSQQDETDDHRHPHSQPLRKAKARRAVS
jgi:ferritin-like metal-binding protein YciE